MSHADVDHTDSSAGSASTEAASSEAENIDISPASESVTEIPATVVDGDVASSPKVAKKSKKEKVVTAVDAEVKSSTTEETPAISPAPIKGRKSKASTQSPVSTPELEVESVQVHSDASQPAPASLSEVDAADSVAPVPQTQGKRGRPKRAAEAAAEDTSSSSAALESGNSESTESPVVDPAVPMEGGSATAADASEEPFSSFDAISSALV